MEKYLLVQITTLDFKNPQNTSSSTFISYLQKYSKQLRSIQLIRLVTTCLYIIYSKQVLDSSFVLEDQMEIIT